MYNLTNITLAKTPWDQLKAVNDLSGYMYVGLIILVLYFILFVVFRHHGSRVALLGISFMMSIIGIMSYFLKLISWWIAVIPLLIFIISILIYKLSE
jgi:CHASE2 domain-containing sensor protein